MPSDQPTTGPTDLPTLGPPDDHGFPTSIYGLPVYTVAGINQIAADGKLDGRMAAVAGYWVQLALPCAFMPHTSPVLGFCNGGRFGGTLADLGMGGGAPAPILVPETAEAAFFLELVGPDLDTASPVELIVHAADSRAWQCSAADHGTCFSNLVIDRIAWFSDDVMPNGDVVSNVQPHMTLDQVKAVAVQPGQTFVLADALPATQINEVDPRLVGKIGGGVVWYVRLMSGTPDADGVVEGRDVVVDDATGAVIADLPLEVDPAYTPARLTLDVNGRVPDVEGRSHFSLSKAGTVIAKGVLTSSSSPFALEPGDYAVDTWTTSGAILRSPPPPPGCHLDLTLAAGDDVAYYAQWPDQGGRGDCTWVKGSLFP